MRIVVVHSFYSASQPSGENRVVDDQVGALQEAGHEVHLVRQDTDHQSNLLYPLATAIRVATGTGSNPMKQLRALQPDIVHVHNLFPNFATNWTSEWQGPLVVSVHNYRSICSNGMFFRDGNICVKCSSGNTWPAVIHGCYRDSHLASMPVAMSRARDRRNVLERADAVVTTSNFSDQVMKRYLKNTIDTNVIPNFGADGLRDRPKLAATEQWLAMGRFSPEKGFLELVRDWPPDERLLLIGDGPLREDIVRNASDRPMDVLGSVSREQMRTLMEGSLGLVFPSRWFEVDPQVVVEAMRVGLPVVALDGNAVSQVVLRSGAGSVYTDASSLASALRSVRDSRIAMSRAALAEYERNWTKDVWLARIEALYSQLLAKYDAS